MDKTRTISVIEDLLETVEDGRLGFADAAAKLDDDGKPGLAAEMREFSQQRLRMFNELKALAAAEGVSIDRGNGGSAAGTVHRGWMALRGILSGDDPHGVLAAAEQGEDYALAEYKRALKAEMPPTVRSVLDRQLDEVMAAHDRVRDLRDSVD